MRTEGILAGFALFAGAAAIVGASPARGPASGELLVAVDAPRDTDGYLRVIFRNAGAGPIVFALGGRSGLGPMYTIDYIATLRDGTRCELADVTAGGVVGGYVSPIVIHLAPGEVNLVSIELKNLRCLSKSSVVDLGRLLRAGASIRVVVRVSAESNAWAKVVNGWTGTAASGVFTRQPASKASKAQPRKRPLIQ